MKSFWKRRRDQKAFSLIEVLIATAILGTAGCAFLLGLTSGIMGSQRVSQGRAALDVAQAQLEFVKLQTWDASGASYQKLTLGQLHHGITPSDIDLSATLLSGVQTQLITVTVHYDGGNRSVTLEGYKTDRIIT